MVPEISPRELHARLSAGAAPLVLDVREAWELELARLPGTVDIPMNEVSQRLAELPRDQDIVVLCKAGGRSLQVAAYLMRQGYRAANLTGGIIGWAREVDASVGTY
jgi:rhodanese-related sulfurtransferase